MSGAPVQGAVSRPAGRARGIIQGWCWSPARPADRLTVALLIDGEERATVIAARLRSELIRPGLCDGYHGFSLSLPADLAATARIEVAECDSGQIVARIVPPETAEICAWTAQAEAAYAKAAGLHERLPLRAAAPRWSALAPAFAEMGRRFARRPLPSPGLPPGLRLPVVARPCFSLWLDAGFGTQAILESVVASAPLLRHYRAEVIVSDDGRNPASASLASLPGVHLCVTRAEPGAARANEAAAQARGQCLVFLRPGAISPCGLAELLTAARGQAGVLLGAVAQMTAQRAGFGDLFSHLAGDAVRSGLSLSAAKDLFQQLGGFDAAMEDGTDLPMLDFALRAEEAGGTVRAWREALAYNSPAGPHAAAARARFLARWGA